MTGDLPLRERKKLATRAALARAALELGLERGIDHVTVEDIAAAADVSPRTFFNYFATKEQAFIADDLDRCQSFLASFVAQPDGLQPWHALRAATVEAFTANLRPERDRALRERLVRANPKVLLELFHHLEELDRDVSDEVARRCGQAATSLPVRLQVAAVGAALRASFETWQAQQSATLADLLEDAFSRLAPAFDRPACAAPAPREQGD